MSRIVQDGPDRLYEAHGEAFKAEAAAVRRDFGARMARSPLAVRLWLWLHLRWTLYRQRLQLHRRLYTVRHGLGEGDGPS